MAELLTSLAFVCKAREYDCRSTIPMPSLSVNMAALAAGAEAAGTAVPITETGGVKEVKGIWDKSDEAAMKAMLPGSVVLFHGDTPKFGFVPLANAVQSKPTGLEVKVSMTGDTH